MSLHPPRILIIGAGSRGRAYAEAVSTATNGVVTAVAEPDTFKRRHLGKTYIWGDGPAPEGSEFGSWEDFVVYERERRRRAATAAAVGDVAAGVDAVFVCVLDEMHRDVVIGLAELGGLHIMCEKPLATRLDDCVAMYRAVRDAATVFSIGHVLRYSPHNIALRKLLLEDRVIGDILSVNHTEPVGWWHFTHSYVRGNWRRESKTAPSLLTKSCHDIDLLLWLLCSPPSYTDLAATPHIPSSVSSSGSLQLFRQSRKPVAAGMATNCLSCPVEAECKYSAKRVYLGGQLNGLAAGNTQWPVNIVVPEIEDLCRDDPKTGHDALLARLTEDYDATTPDSEIAGRNWFGRCVFEADNDVCDEQVVVMTWDEDPLPTTQPADDGALATADSLGHRGAKTATFHMVAHTSKICERFSHFYGVDGEVYADSSTITVQDFRTGQTAVHNPRIEGLGQGHGGGDLGLTRQFVQAVDRVKNGGWSSDRAQREIVGCTLEEIIRSHAMVFCAEAARTGRTVMDWAEWWTREVHDKLSTPF